MLRKRLGKKKSRRDGNEHGVGRPAASKHLRHCIYQRYVRATLRGGDFLSPTEPALTPSVPIPRSSFDVQKNGVRNCRTVRARPRAQSERDRTRPLDRKPLPEAVALIGRLECAPFRSVFFFFCRRDTNGHKPRIFAKRLFK